MAYDLEDAKDNHKSRDSLVADLSLRAQRSAPQTHRKPTARALSRIAVHGRRWEDGSGLPWICDHAREAREAAARLGF